MFTRPKRSVVPGLLMALALAAPTVVQSQATVVESQVTTPQEEFGFQLGADYQLINYQQFSAYVNKIAAESDRVTVESIGKTEQGRDQLMAIITSPENHARLDHYRDIARRMARGEEMTEEQARALAQEGKAVVWIDGGLHATEVLGAHQLTELIFRMASYDDPETLRFLDDVILLAVHANPDGHDLVADWYMRHDDPLERTTEGVPLLYNHYAGHDNNRDFFMSNLAETTNMNRVMYREWYPEIIYNHHQTGPEGTIMFAPPFRDPPNQNLDPMIITGLDQVGSAMHARFVQEGKGGTTMRSGASYSTWWNGGLRTTPYFKNMIGLLTETRGHPTPIEIPFVPEKQISKGDLPLPVEPGLWHFRQSIEYSETANWAVLDYASRNRDRLLYNIWRMARNSIERGSHDSWTIIPSEIDRAAEAVGDSGTEADYERLLHAHADRDARGYILSSDQRDFPTATKFVNTLLKNGVEVQQATASFTVAGKSYPAGSYVIKTDQAFRPHVLDMFEAQDHPNDFAYPGAPPTRPYDITGWTLAYQMGVEFDRVLDGFDGPFQPIEWLAEPMPGEVTGGSDVEGWLFSHGVNDAFLAVNRLLAAGQDVYWLTSGGSDGAFFVESGSGTAAMVGELARNLGVDFQGVTEHPAGSAMKLAPVKVGLWDRYGGSIPSGWTRFVLEKFGFDYDLLYPAQLEGDLSAYDVLVFPDESIPMDDEPEGGERSFRGRQPDDAPAEYQKMLGNTTVATTVPAILEFARRGGTVVAVGSATNLAYHAQLPVTNHLTENGAPLPDEKYYVPGSVLDLKLEHVSPVLDGMGERVDVMFDQSPVFTLEDGAAAAGVRALGWFDRPDPLLSGWAWGQHYLENGVSLLEADYGQGKLFLYGPRVTFRGQPHGTFPLLLNALLYGSAESTMLQAEQP